MPEGTSAILDTRSLATAHRRLAALLRPGLAVLDVGCGTGAITRGIAEAVGHEGRVVGVDVNAAMIDKARAAHGALAGLSFEVADRYSTDVIVRAGIRLSLERDTIKTPIDAPFQGWVSEIERLLSPAGEWELMGLSAPADVAARVIVTCLIGTQYLSKDGDADMTKRLGEVWTVILPGLRPTPDLAARIATGQALRERARAAAAATAPTTMYRTIDMT